MITSTLESVNLLPARVAQERRAKQALRVWLVAVGATLFVGAASLVASKTPFAGDGVKATESLLERRVVLAELSAAIETASAELDSERARADLFGSVRGSEDWGALILLCTQTAPDGLSFDRLAVSTRNDGSILLELAGSGEKTADVLEFASALERSGVFESIAAPTIKPAEARVAFMLEAMLLDAATGTGRFAEVAP